MVEERTRDQMAETVRQFERSLGIADGPAPGTHIPLAIRDNRLVCPTCVGYERIGDDIPCPTCCPDGQPRASVYIDREAVARVFGGGETYTQAASARLTLSRFIDYLESRGMVIGEYGKSEGGGSPLTPVHSASGIVEDFVHHR